MNSDVGSDETKYTIAFTLQRDTPSGVETMHRLGWVTGRPGRTTQGAIDWLRQECGLASADYRVVAHYVGLFNPFSVPTRCLVSITLMPGGAGFAARLREHHRVYTISDKFTTLDALNEMFGEEQSDSIIGYNISPVRLA